MQIKSICVISNRYPDVNDPIYSFLDEIVDQFMNMGIDCTVITPISNLEHKKAEMREWKTRSGNTVRIYCPDFIMFPSRQILGRNTSDLTVISFRDAAYKAFKKYVKKCDAIYAHFLLMGGLAAEFIGKKEGIPTFVACGESSFDDRALIYKDFEKAIRQIDGIISVSTKNKRELLQRGYYQDSERISVIPNSIDPQTFRKLDKDACRTKTGIDKSKFVVAFVGHFIDRKGIGKVISAINRLEDVYGIFIGGAKLPIECKKALFVGKIEHRDLPVYLSAADVFVLPTQNEGCCNAIIEAQACGLPVISSDREFNYDILSNDDAILIDPNDVDAITNAIASLRDSDQLRTALSVCSLKRAKTMDIGTRAQKIISFMESIIESGSR